MTDIKDLYALASIPPDEQYAGIVLQVGSVKAPPARYQSVTVHLWHRSDGGRTCILFGQDGDFCRVPWLSQESSGGILSIRSKSGGEWRIQLD